MRMKHVLPLMLVLALAGCAPYALAVKETYDVATDPRSLATQATDTEAEAQIKAALVASPVSGTSGIDVYCRQGVVVLVGVVPPGSQAGQAAVAHRAPDAGREAGRDVLRALSALLGERHRHQGTDQSDPHRGPRPGIRPGRHRRLRGPCRSRRGRRLARECSEVHCRRALGEWRRVRDVLHPDGLGCVSLDDQKRERASGSVRR